MTITQRTHQYQNIAALLDQPDGHISIGRMLPLMSTDSLPRCPLVTRIEDSPLNSAFNFRERLPQCPGISFQEPVVATAIIARPFFHHGAR